MEFPPSFIDELILHNPIEDVVGQYVTLRRAGANMFGLCPFHGEKTASFSVTPDKGLYYCFGCHKGGGAINFQMEIEGLSYPDAVRALARRAGMTVPEDEQYQSRYQKQERLWALHKEAARYFHSQLYAPVGKAALEYALGRGMSRSILTTFGIGYAPDSWDGLIKAAKAKGYTDEELIEGGLAIQSKDKTQLFDRFRERLMFPIIDVRGNIIGFGGRTLMKNPDEKTPKYMNTPETPIFNKRKNLFGLNFAKKSKLGYLILVEGNVDVVALHQFGFDNAIASLGTTLTEEQAALLTRYADQIVLVYDGDKAGQNATQRAIPILEKVGLQVKVLHIEGAKDPDEFLHKYGADRFKLLLEDSSNRVEYQLNAIAAKYDLREDDQRVRFLQESADLISTLGSAVQREVYGSRVAEKAKISAESMKIEIDRARKRRADQQKKKQEQIDLSPVRNLQPKSRTIRYDNMKSARAEEGVITLALREPALLDRAAKLPQSAFSSPLLGKVYGMLKMRHSQGLEVSLAVLEDLDQEEMSHMVGVSQNQNFPVNEQAFDDCVAIILAEHQSASVSSEEDLRALQSKLRERKGIKG